MNSIKIKFTFTLTLVILSIISLFALLIYYVNVNIEGPITPEVLEQVGQESPRIQSILERFNENQTISEVYDLVRQEQIKKYQDIIMIFVPVSIFTSALIAYAVSTYLLRPIEELAISIKRIGINDISQRIKVKNSSTEIELLSTSFNDLMEKLENSFKSQDQFIQDAAHELRTPIAAIKTNIQVFKENKDNKIEDYKILMEKIEKINNKLVNLSENLFLLNKQNTSKLNLQKTNLKDICEDVTDTLLSIAGKKKINIKNIINDKLFVFIDAFKFSIAIKNILENAIKYSNENTEIVINASETKRKIILSITDHGNGISEESLKRIFDRFYRGENSNGEDGAGLGLSIVKKIINEHSGDIKVKSELNKGTIFEVFLNKNNFNKK